MDKDMTEFLIRAKKATYAGKGNETESSRPQSHDLVYGEDNLYYIDTYLGGINFSGEEAVWKDGIPVWAMNYSGRVLNDYFDGDFLKEALLNVTKEMPYRGPEYFTKDEFEYYCDVRGETEWFRGSEKIHVSGEKVYECFFHGGIVK